MINHLLFVTWLLTESTHIIDGSSIESRFYEAPKRDAAAWRWTEMSADRTLQGIDYGLDVPSVTTERNHYPNNVPVIRYPAGNHRDDESNDADSTLTMDVENGEFPNYNPDFVEASDRQTIDYEEDSQQQYDSSSSPRTQQFADADDNENIEGNSKQQLDPSERLPRYGHVDTTNLRNSHTMPNEYPVEILSPHELGYDGFSVMTKDIKSPYKLDHDDWQRRLYSPVFDGINYSAEDSHPGNIDGGGSNPGQSIVPVSKYREQDEDDDDSRPRLSKKRKVTGRRYYLEPLIDGAILGTLGALFSDEIKREANRDRIEREKAYEQELLEKYTRIFDDPVELAKLAREAAKSPTYINQFIRRSFPLLSTKLYEKYQANLSSPGHVAARSTGPNERTAAAKQREYSPRTFYKNHVHPRQRRLVVDSNSFGYRNKSRRAYTFPVRGI